MQSVYHYYYSRSWFCYVGESCVYTSERPRSTMVSSQPAVRTTKLCLLMASHVKAFHKNLTNSGSALPRAACLEGNVMRCHHLTIRMCSGICRHATNTPSVSCIRTNNLQHPCPNVLSALLTFPLLCDILI